MGKWQSMRKLSGKGNMKILPSQQIPYDITYMWHLKYDTNEPIYEAETESQT